MPPTPTNGKICYIEIPAVDVQRSARFYEQVFGWRTRERGDGHLAFDDTTGQVSGSWVVGRPPSPQPGLLLYIMVDSVAAAVEAVIAHGGDIVQPVGADAPEVTARFSDPAGNVIGLYQEPGDSPRSCPSSLSPPRAASCVRIWLGPEAMDRGPGSWSSMMPSA
jgi:predicted enzyme related to lactoylglutathione lyase